MKPPIALDATTAESTAAFRALERTQAMVRSLDGTIRQWSTGMQRLYGYSSEDAIGRRSQQLLRTEFSRPSDEIAKELLANEVWNGELTNYRKDGTRVCVASQWSLWRDGSDTEVVEVHSDITSLKLAEQ